MYTKILLIGLDPSSPVFSEPKFRDVDWYEIFGDRTILQPGDIIVKSTPDDNQTPPVTFAHSMPIKAGIGFRTSRIGMITNQFDEPIYTNVYFDFLGASYPGSSINKKLEKSLQIPTVRVVIFKRDNLFRLRTQLIETDSNLTITKDGVSVPYQRKWKVEEIQHTGNFMLLTLNDNLDA